MATFRQLLKTSLQPLGRLKAAISAWRKLTARWSAAVVLSSAIGIFALGLTSCAQSRPPIRLLDLPDLPTGSETRRLSGDISEVAPPAVLLDLANLASDLQPQVKIAYPRPGQTIKETQVAVEVGLKGLSIYKDDETQLGPHLKVIIDNQPARDIYRLDEPIEFSDLLPGSHTLRVLAVLPWGETFKNSDAYAQSTFHVLASTGENTPAADSPVLTYSEPQGVFGAQPVPLDFYLSNAPLHLVAQESTEDDVRDWQIRCTIDGQSFLFDRWQPIYLQGLKPGQHWVQVELVDDKGDRIPGPFNSTVRLISYDPSQKDTLSKLIRGELPIEQIGQIVIPGYVPPTIEELPSKELPSEELPSEEPNKTEEPGVEKTEVEDVLIQEETEESLPPLKEPENSVPTESNKLELRKPTDLELRKSEAEPLIEELEEKKVNNRLDESIESRSLNFEEADSTKNNIKTEEAEISEEETSEAEISTKQNATDRDNQFLKATQKDKLTPAEPLNAEKNIEGSLQSSDRAGEEYLPKSEPSLERKGKLPSETEANSLNKSEKTAEEVIEEPTAEDKTIDDLETHLGADEFGEASTRIPSQIPRVEKSIEAEPPQAKRSSEPNLLERLRTQWRSFQKGQTEAQTGTIQPSTTPAVPAPTVEANEVKADEAEVDEVEVDEVEIDEAEADKAEATELEIDRPFDNQPQETAP